MLAIAERLVNDAGLDWVFCDTDSMAIAKPAEMDHKAFVDKCRKVVGWFDCLNPSEAKGPLFKNANFGLGSKDIAPLYCYAISSKRYALFNLDAKGESILRKASAHGLSLRDLPEAFGDWNSVFRRFSRWSAKGVWWRIFEAMSDDPDFEYLILDSAIVRAHQHAAGAKKGGLKIKRSAARAAA